MKKSNRYSSEYGKEIWKELEHVSSFGYSYYNIFSDWTDFIINALLSLTDNMRKKDSKNFFNDLENNKFDGKFEDRYIKGIDKYKENKTREVGKRPVDYFTNAWAKLQLDTSIYEEDVLGHIFEDRISHGNNGQFMTPYHLCDLISSLTLREEVKRRTKIDLSTKIINDLACGSGRLLISSLKLKKDCKLIGQDISPIMVKMSAINMWLFNADAEIYCGNTLTNKWDYMYLIKPGGYIYEIDSKVEVKKRRRIEI